MDSNLFHGVLSKLENDAAKQARNEIDEIVEKVDDLFSSTRSRIFGSQSDEVANIIKGIRALTPNLTKVHFEEKVARLNAALITLATDDEIPK